jgi:hypothetical protein
MNNKKIWNFFIFLIFLILMFSISIIPAVAKDNQPDNPIITPPPGDPADFRRFDLINTLQIDSPYYNSNDRYGTEGTRFGPPENRATEIPFSYKNQGSVILDATDHQWYGTGIYPSASQSVWGYLQISTTLTLDENYDTLYAPTMLAPNDSRLELVVFYKYNGSSTDRKLKVWDHYQETFNTSTDIDSTFCDRYVRNSFISASVIKDGSTWYALIWDYTDSHWDEVCGAYGDGTHDEGWVIWEEWYIGNTWPELPQVVGKYVSVKVDGDWVYVTYPTYGTQAYHLHDGFPYYYGWDNYYYTWYIGSN